MFIVKGPDFYNKIGRILADLDVIGERSLEAERLRERDLALQQAFLPVLVDHVLAELEAERPRVAQEASRQQAVADEPLLLRVEVLQVQRPSATSQQVTECDTKLYRMCEHVWSTSECVPERHL